MMLWLAVAACSASDEPEPEGPAAPAAEDHLGGASPTPVGVTFDEAGSATCPEGVIAAPGWPGEYPTPVVDLMEPIRVKGRTHPCAESATVACEVPPGLYHPWAGDAQDFVTVRAVQRFEATGRVKIGNHKVKPGTLVEMTQDLGEGFCQYQIEGETLQAQCPQLITSKLSPVSGATRAPVQLMRVPCRTGEGTTHAWLEVDKAMMAHAKVREGKILEYGRVGHATGPRRVEPARE